MPLSNSVGCSHEPKQTGQHLFECSYCGMVFPGIDRSNPDFGRIVDTILIGDSLSILSRSSYFHDPRMAPGAYTTVKHVDLGPVPSQIEELKVFVIAQETAIREIKNELSRFIDILKIAVER